MELRRSPRIRPARARGLAAALERRVGTLLTAAVVLGCSGAAVAVERSLPNTVVATASDPDSPALVAARARSAAGKPAPRVVADPSPDATTVEVVVEPPAVTPPQAPTTPAQVPPPPRSPTALADPAADPAKRIASAPAIADVPGAVAAVPGAITLGPITLADGGPRLVAFAGLSTWVDLYDVALTPVQQADVAAAGGAQLVYVQSARYNSPDHIHDAARLAQLIEASHDRGMRVMVWYLPGFVDPALDLYRSEAAAAFVTPRGDRPDAFGLDIETETQPDVAERTRQLLALSRALRDWAGPAYPMAAIVLPPLQLDLRPSWWPNFPWADLAALYDVIVPMSYSSFRGTDANTTYAWNLDNILRIRELTGRPSLPIHMAGGIADNLPAVDAWLAALRDGAVLGGGLYDLHTTRPEAWQALRALHSP